MPAAGVMRAVMAAAAAAGMVMLTVVEVTSAPEVLPIGLQCCQMGTPDVEVGKFSNNCQLYLSIRGFCPRTFVVRMSVSMTAVLRCHASADYEVA